MRQILLASLSLACAANVRADDAVDWQGRMQRGELVRDAGTWAFRGSDAKLGPIKQISYIRFHAAATPLPKAPLTHTLHLPQQQQIAGMLRSIDAKQVEFITSWGKTVHLDRHRVVGIEQACNARILLHDDFEQMDRERAFYGAASLLLDQANPEAKRAWKPSLSDGDIRLYFYDPANNANARFAFDLIPTAGREPIRMLVLDANGYACDKQRATFGTVKRSAGWHPLNFELRAGRLRVYVDDACLGENKIDAINGIRISCGAGKLWIDELMVTQRLPALLQPQSAKDADMLWLPHGEQLFGRLSSADGKTVTLDSKLGKLSLPWQQVRGIYVALPKEPAEVHDPEITFRPGSGFPLDQLRAKLLRWDNGKLIVEHALLGEIALARACLDKIRWPAK